MPDSLIELQKWQIFARDNPEKLIEIKRLYDTLRPIADGRVNPDTVPEHYTEALGTSMEIQETVAGSGLHVPTAEAILPQNIRFQEYMGTIAELWEQHLHSCWEGKSAVSWDAAEAGVIQELIDSGNGNMLDFVNNRYTKEWLPVDLSAVSEFIRLSSATQWKDGVLVDVAADVMRLENTKGLLIEKSSTELIPNNSSLTSTNTAWTATQKTDAQIGSVFEFVSGGSAATIQTNVPVYPAGNVAANNGYYYRSILAKKTDVDSYLNLGSVAGQTMLILNLRDGSVVAAGVYVAQHKVTLIGHYYLIESLSSEIIASDRQYSLISSNNRGSAYALGVPTAGHKVTVAFPSFRDTADFPQSIIKTTGVQSSRAKETLVIPFAVGQTVAADKDEGVTMTIVDNNAVFEGQGYIRSIEVN